MADQFHHTINHLHPKLKFKLEKPETTPNGLSLSLLDFKVTISKDGKSSFEFYEKNSQETTIRTPSISYTQEIKDQLHLQCNERKRIDDRCSTQTTTTKHQDMFDDILHQNVYPENSIDQTKHPQSQQRDPRPPNAEWSYLMIPYISERLNYKITNIFRKEGARGHTSTCRAQIIHPQTSSLPQHHRAYMHQEELPHL